MSTADIYDDIFGRIDKTQKEIDGKSSKTSKTISQSFSWFDDDQLEIVKNIDEKIAKLNDIKDQNNMNKENK